MPPRAERTDGTLRRLTIGVGDDFHASCAPSGEFAFTNLQIRTDFWALPFDLNRREPKGTLERITQGPAHRGYASLSNNGRYVAFSSDQVGSSKHLDP